MATIEVHYSMLESVARSARSLSGKAADYADSLSRKVAGGISGVSGGGNANLNQASYYVNKKLQSLREKSASYGQYSVDVAQFADTAKRVDQQVRSEIAMNQENFLQHNEHLRISPWKETLIHLLADLQNKSDIFRAITILLDEILNQADRMGDILLQQMLKTGGAKHSWRDAAKYLALPIIMSAMGIAFKGVLFDVVSGLKDKLVEGGSKFLNTITKHNLSSEIYERWMESAVKSQVDGGDLLVDANKWYESLKNGVFDQDTYEATGELVTTTIENMDSKNGSKFIPSKLNVIWTTMKTVPKYGDMQDELEKQAVKDIKNGDYLAIGRYLGQSLVLFGKAFVDVSAQLIDSTFKLGFLGDTCSIITGVDVAGGCNQISSSINNYVDRIFGL